MILDYLDPGALLVNMVYYIQGILKEFLCKVKATNTAPWNRRLFKVDIISKKIYEEQRGVFHTFFMKCIFLCKRGRPNITPRVGFMSLRVREANEGYWNKLLRLMGFLKEQSTLF